MRIKSCKLRRGKDRPVESRFCGTSAATVPISLGCAMFTGTSLADLPPPWGKQSLGASCGVPTELSFGSRINVVSSYAASSALMKQIEQGALVDVFLFGLKPEATAVFERYGFACPTKLTILPVSVENGQLIVNANINGQGPFPMLFDTGSVEAITPKIATALGLSVEGAGTVRGKNGERAGVAGDRGGSDKTNSGDALEPRSLSCAMFDFNQPCRF